MPASAWHSVVGWSPAGDELVILSDRNGTPGLWAVPVKDSERAGAPRPLKADFQHRPVGVTATGGLVYESVSGPVAARLATVRLDANGQWTPESRAVIGTVAITSRSDGSGNDQELWWIPVDGRMPRRIDVGTTKIAENPVAVHPDGRQIAFVAGGTFFAAMPNALSYASVRAGAPREWRVFENLLPTRSGR